MRRVNILSPEFDHASERDGFRWRGSRVGAAVGAEKLGGCLYELPEGELTYPFHFHPAMEEWLLVLAGSPVVRTPEGERILRAGDLLCFPAGPSGGHQVRGPGRVLIISAGRSPETSEYPESGKIAVWRQPERIFRAADAVGYWDGE